MKYKYTPPKSSLYRGIISLVISIVLVTIVVNITIFKVMPSVIIAALFILSIIFSYSNLKEYFFSGVSEFILTEDYCGLIRKGDIDKKLYHEDIIEVRIIDNKNEPSFCIFTNEHGLFLFKDWMDDIDYDNILEFFGDKVKTKEESSIIN